MKARGIIDHHTFAEALRRSVLDGPGDTLAILRQAAAARAASDIYLDDHSYR